MSKTKLNRALEIGIVLGEAQEVSDIPQEIKQFKGVRLEIIK